MLANDGIRMPITLIADQLGEGQQVISKDTAYDVRSMLEGTSKKATIEGYRVGGKSGTAKKTSGSGGYSEDRYRSFFAGIAPLDDPRLIVVVFIDEPTGDYYYGGDVAAPVFSKVTAESLRLLSIPPSHATFYDIPINANANF